ncbi:MAG: division/cell wall cluster transcriptional repressor MraZ [Bacilli bacterium]
MLTGQKDLSIDEKGRLVLPTLYRSAFSNGISYTSYGIDNCIRLYPEESYTRQATRYMELDDFNVEARKVKRTFLSNTFEVQIDSHNRILLPKPLTDKTGIVKKVVVVGLGDYLEIWDADTFYEMMEQNEKTYSSDCSLLIGSKNNG